MSDPGKSIRPLPAEPPFRWGPLEVLEQIGDGAFGRIYRAHDPSLRRDVALKLHPIASTIASTERADGEAHLQEARRLARVRHPNVLVVHGAAVHDDLAGIWTDLVPGESIELQLRRDGPLSRESLLRVGVDLCSALEAVHAVGLAHGDLRPAAAMRQEDGRVLLLDFGAGTAAVPSAAADLGALGELLYHLSTGSPFSRSSERPPLDEPRPDLPVAFARVVERALAEQPRDRPASASELRWLIAASLGADEVEFGFEAGPEGNLPNFSTHFIGRASELRQLRTLLTAPGLVTIVGAGGCGKTRLAARLASEFHHSLPGGAVWLDLALIGDGANVAATAARAAGLSDRTGQSAEGALVEWIADRSLALVLDNAEHLRRHVAEFAEFLLVGCPRLRLVVTSRQRLSAPGERTFRLGEMAVPADRGAPDGVEIVESDSVRLFVDRARRLGDDFRLTPATAPDVARIVRRVEGIPLAVELAAARVSTLGLPVVADKLDESYRLLSARGLAEVERHSTITTSIAWSYELLEPEEARLLTRLAVFSGGCSAAGAEAVCAEAADAPDAAAASGATGFAELLESLVEASLVSSESAAADEPRYRLLALVRAFAMERLEAGGEAADIRDRRLAWIEHEAAVRGPKIHGPEMPSQMAWFDREQGNVRAALEHREALVRAGSSKPERWISLCLNVRPYWYQRGQFREGLEQFRLALSFTPLDSAFRVSALNGLALFHRLLGQMDSAIEALTESVARARAENNPNALALSLASLAALKSDTGHPAEGRRHYEEALAIRESAPNPPHTTAILCNLGVIEAAVGDLSAAKIWYERALEHARGQQDVSAVAHVTGNLAITLLELGELDAARGIAAESLLLSRSTESLAIHWVSLRATVLLRILDARLAEACDLVREMLDALGSDPSPGVWIGTVETAVDLFFAQGQCEETTELLGSIDAVQGRASLPVPAGFIPRWDRRREALREALGPERFTAAWTRGRVRSMAEALELARQVI